MIDGQGAQSEAEELDDALLDPFALADVVEGFSKRRVELVQKAAKEWRHALEDLGGRNNLLSYRDRSAATLDLTNADRRAVASLLQSKAVKTSALFPNPEERAAQLKRVRTIHNTAKENYEERGLETLSIGCGLATWENSKRGTWTPSAPVLLRQASLHSLGAAQDEFELTLLDEMEVNPTLIHLLHVDFECDLRPEELLDRVDGVIDEPWELEETFKWMSEKAKRVPGFSIDPRIVLTNFAYAKLPMVKDIENAFDELVAHDLIAAIAGDKEAQEKLRSEGPGADAIPSVDATALADEFLVLDADSSQNWAINQALAGANLIVRGPPGTGKSQTIANLIAALAAREKTVLFVAEKRAAIDAVLKRLQEKKLGDLVLDLHASASSRRVFAQRVGEALLSTRNAPRVDRNVEQRRLEAQRDQLNEHVRVLHEPRQPWALSVYEIRAELIGLADYETGFRLRGDKLQALDKETYESLEARVRDYARLDGFTLQLSENPWRKAEIVSAEEAQEAFDAVEELRRHTLATALHALRSAAEETDLPWAKTLKGWGEVLAVWGDVRATLGIFQPGIFDERIADLCTRMAPAEIGAVARFRSSLFSAEYKTARRELWQLLIAEKHPHDLDLLSAAKAACAQLELWRVLDGQAAPTAPTNLGLEALCGELQNRLADVEQRTNLTELADLPIGELEALVVALTDDRPTLMRLPEVHQLRNAFAAAGIAEVIAEMSAAGASEERAVQGLRYGFLKSILDYLSTSEVAIEAFSAKRHEATVNDFRKGDLEHLETTPDRIRRLVAERTVKARQEHPQQEQEVVAQARRMRRHRPVRDVVRDAEDVLLALKPCWAMSPLHVSQLLPTKTMFDVVIFDEASQITPADAIGSIVRGKQLIVAGDSKQLPPTAFFISEVDEEDEPELEDSEPRPLIARTQDYESILDVLDLHLRWRMLRWHYRSRDERLIAFSNAHIYDRQLITFPGVGAEFPLRFELAEWDPTAERNSPSPEVELVVDLIVEHARQRPVESLGVIAMGIRHSGRVEEALRQRMRETPGLAEELGDFFAEDREERFFVKNLERVQGDERDAIILSIGYGKNKNGVVPMHFGPINKPGGERRLNVAITRAKHRLTLVSSFKHSELDLERSNAAGVQLLSQYLQYVESAGRNLGDSIVEKPQLNPFEVDVKDTLTKRGLRLTPQYGTSGYWIDFAVHHKTRPEYVLAIECDGATYHSSESARDRDRLRQEQLERLGWRFHRIWSSEWFYDRERAVDKVLKAFEKACQAADKPAKKEAPKRSAEVPSEPGDRRAADRVAEKVREAFTAAPRSGSSTQKQRAGRPRIPRGYPIDDYRPADLVALARWIDEGDALLTDEELLREMMRELGFKRLGSKVDHALTQAVKRARNT